MGLGALTDWSSEACRLVSIENNKSKSMQNSRMYVLAAVVLLLGCSKHPTTSTAPSGVTAGDAESRRMSAPLEMKEWGQFTEKLRGLRAGQAYNEVIALLGPPHLRDDKSAMEHDRFMGTSVTYYVAKASDGVHVRNDRYVILHFDEHGRLESYEINQGEVTIPGLPEINAGR
jgi:hypothetical protein